jgi:PIN domain nuclease of toxin-antitoxin system
LKLLLDTHAFIWLCENDVQLSVNAKQHIENESNEIFVSVASLWEIAIKMSLKKLKVKNSFREMVNNIDKNGFQLFPISILHIEAVSKLKYFHRDPFGRMLIAQSKSEKRAIVGKDELFDKYKVRRIW